MTNPLLTPDAAWIIGTIITAGPAYLLAARHSNRRVELKEHSEHETTRQATLDALNAVVGPLNGRLDEMHATMADMHEWQADHALTHATHALSRSPMLEYRKGQ